MNYTINTLFLFLVSITLVVTANAQVAGGTDEKAVKITVDTLVAKHLASIGTPDAIAAAKTRVYVGEGRIRSQIEGTIALSGPGQMATEGNKLLFAMLFEAPLYPYEKIAFDGKDQTLGRPSGRRTMLAEYLRAQSSITKDNLLSGVLSNGWPLLDVASKSKVKLELAGTTKIDGRECYKVKYSSSRTGVLRISMFFDTDSFRHVRTEYHYTTEPSIGLSSTDTRSSSRVERYTMEEDFSDFKKAGQLILPTRYKITVTTDGQIDVGVNKREWSFSIDSVYFNEPLLPEVFKVS